MVTNYDWLPMGSVVRLDQADKPLMIAGVMVTDGNTGKLWDYLGYPYPEGRRSGDNFFDKNDIVEIKQVGYMNGLGCAFQAYLEETTPEFEADKAKQKKEGKEA